MKHNRGRTLSMMYFILKVLVGAAIYLFIWTLWSRRKYYVLAFKLPGSLGYPLIGAAHEFLNREAILVAFGKYIKKYGANFLAWLGPLPVFVTSDPQTCRDVLTSTNCVNKAVIYDVINITLGGGLFSLDNPEWRRHRKLLNPAFSSGNLHSFIRIFNDGTNDLMTIFDRLKPDDEIDVMPILMENSLAFATKTTMGLKWSLGEESENKNLMHIFQRQIITKKMHKNDTIDNSRNIFSHLALELLNNGQFTWNDVVTESNVIIFGAFETSALSITFTLIMLAMHPEYQERAFEEIKSIIPTSETSEVTNEEIHKMTYLEMVINETMRIMTIVPLIGRRTSGDVKLSDGTVLPEGVQVVIDLFHMHRDENIWGTEAHLFNPDNFLPENVEKRHPYSFIPFTKGIRSCIGEKYAYNSLKVVLAKLIRNYRFDTKFKYEDLRFIENITLKLGKMPLIMFTKRC